MEKGKIIDFNSKSYDKDGEKYMKYFENFNTNIFEYIQKKINVQFFVYGLSEKDKDFLDSLSDMHKDTFAYNITLKLIKEIGTKIISCIDYKNSINNIDTLINAYLSNNIFNNLEETFNKIAEEEGE